MSVSCCAPIGWGLISCVSVACAPIGWWLISCVSVACAPIGWWLISWQGEGGVPIGRKMIRWEGITGAPIGWKLITERITGAPICGELISCEGVGGGGSCRLITSLLLNKTKKVSFCFLLSVGYVVWLFSRSAQLYGEALLFFLMAVAQPRSPPPPSPTEIRIGDPTYDRQASWQLRYLQ